MSDRKPIKPATRLVEAGRREEWTGARWEEIEADAAGRWTFRIPASRMKGGRPHSVPLPRAAVDLLEPMRGGGGGEGFIFSATKVMPAAGRVEARGKFTKKKRVAVEDEGQKEAKKAKVEDEDQQTTEITDTA